MATSREPRQIDPKLTVKALRSDGKVVSEWLLKYLRQTSISCTDLGAHHCPKIAQEVTWTMFLQISSPQRPSNRKKKKRPGERRDKGARGKVTPGGVILVNVMIVPTDPEGRNNAQHEESNHHTHHEKSSEEDPRVAEQYTHTNVDHFGCYKHR